MSGIESALVSNAVIAGLPRGEQRRLLAELEPVDLTVGARLCEPGKRQHNVYFPLSGCVSLAASVANHPAMDLALIGSEGMLGLQLGLGIGNDVPMLGTVKCAGRALRMPAARFRRHLSGGAGLSRAMDRQLFVLLANVARTAVCTSFHEVQARLARWLLMTHDRAHSDHFHLTHELLADMLGVQRSAVTIAAGALQKARVIGYSRGDIHVLDRRGLEAMSCDCYRISMPAARQRGG